MRSWNHKVPLSIHLRSENYKVYKVEKKSDKINARIISKAHAHRHAVYGENMYKV